MSEWRDSRGDALDEALTGYVEAPDNEGLEWQILARFSKRTTRARRVRKLSLMLVMAALATGCLLWWWAHGPSIEIKPAIEIALVSKGHGSAPGPRVSTRSVETVALVAKLRHRSRKQRTDPKLPLFPSPYQIGSDERALLELAKYRAKNAIHESNYIGNPVKPIELMAVEIKPIQ